MSKCLGSEVSGLQFSLRDFQAVSSPQQGEDPKLGAALLITEKFSDVFGVVFGSFRSV